MRTGDRNLLNDIGYPLFVNRYLLEGGAATLYPTSGIRHRYQPPSNPYPMRSRSHFDPNVKVRPRTPAFQPHYTTLPTLAVPRHHEDVRCLSIPCSWPKRLKLVAKYDRQSVHHVGAQREFAGQELVKQYRRDAHFDSDSRQ